jgi:hypothetical protein
VHGAVVEHIGGSANPQKSGALFKGLWPETRDLQQLPPVREGADPVAMTDDVSGQYRPESRYRGEEFEAGGVELYPDLVDAAYDYFVEGFFSSAWSTSYWY